MTTVDYESIINFLKNRKEKIFKTKAQKKEFQVEVNDDGVIYIPSSTRKSRQHEKNILKGLLTDLIKSILFPREIILILQ